MKTLVFFTNCQNRGVWHFLAKTRLAEEYQPVFANNWQFILQELPLEMLYKSAAGADLFIYQPSNEQRDKEGNKIPSSQELIQTVVPSSTPKISLAYQYNNGFFPIIKETADSYTTGHRVAELARTGDMPRFWSAYNSGEMLFDCARRFVGCLAEQVRREKDCDIKMGPFILQNFQKRRLFLNQNHPTSAIFQELARQIYQYLLDDFDSCLQDGHRLNYEPAPKNIGSRLPPLGEITIEGDNDAGMNGELPIHPAVVRELGLEFGPYGDQTVFETYLRDYAKLCQKP